ncbi:hypothetical protein LSH36_58g06011 [Paralvinella palmiformis]|uniref:HTH CENPB-type domain-containing protein n=1 Tax=Paralvinella palmiformis TaxID=53620 RepID=A0AAD9K623_9ANNE|nr:hypothetical protein LSH36_58g06011 [Paralvinella palmiformis]
MIGSLLNTFEPYYTCDPSDRITECLAVPMVTSLQSVKGTPPNTSTSRSSTTRAWNLNDKLSRVNVIVVSPMTLNADLSSAWYAISVLVLIEACIFCAKAKRIMLVSAPVSRDLSGTKAIIHIHSKSSKPGPLPVMIPAVEAEFARKLMDLADREFRLTKQLVLQKAANLCRLAQLQHPFKEGPAGDSWYRAFMRRNPGLTLRTPSRLSTGRGRAMNRAVVGDYLQDVAKYTEGLQPIPIWNMDESGFRFEHQPIKVVCKKGVRAVNSRPVSPSREKRTLLACASAAAAVMPPMFVVNGITFKSLHSK